MNLSILSFEVYIEEGTKQKLFIQLLQFDTILYGNDKSLG